MNVETCIAGLERNLVVFESLLGNPSPAFIDWRPAPQKWNLREILVHLYDEEREDFRARLLHIVYQREGEMKAIDPENWVQSRDYNDMDYVSVLQDFLAERQDSISLLKGISAESWDLEYAHPKWGNIKAHFYLENWLAHDQLHIRQIIRQEYLHLKELADNNIEYAGTW